MFNGEKKRNKEIFTTRWNSTVCDRDDSLCHVLGRSYVNRWARERRATMAYRWASLCVCVKICTYTWCVFVSFVLSLVWLCVQWTVAFDLTLHGLSSIPFPSIGPVAAHEPKQQPKTIIIPFRFFLLSFFVFLLESMAGVLSRIYMCVCVGVGILCLSPASAQPHVGQVT